MADVAHFSSKLKVYANFQGLLSALKLFNHSLTHLHFYTKIGHTVSLNSKIFVEFMLYVANNLSIIYM